MLAGTVNRATVTYLLAAYVPLGQVVDQLLELGQMVGRVSLGPGGRVLDLVTGQHAHELGVVRFAYPLPAEHRVVNILRGEAPAKRYNCALGMGLMRKEGLLPAGTYITPFRSHMQCVSTPGAQTPRSEAGGNWWTRRMHAVIQSWAAIEARAVMTRESAEVRALKRSVSELNGRR